ncbi:MAG TPA: hypothetical protein VIL19_02810, partial [Casimicrobiaceae bacterium]
GTIVAASRARDGQPIIASDRHASVVEDLRAGRTRLIEPGLAALVMAAVADIRCGAGWRWWGDRAWSWR